MESMQEILFARRETQQSAWAEITLNRPAKGNALTEPMLARLGEIVAEIAADRKIRAVVLRGAGRFFCVGGDIRAWSALSPQQMGDEWILRGIAVFQALAALPQPVIAVISGDALGGGLELALAADLRLAVATANLGTPEVTIGMIAGWSGVRRLAETIEVSRARQLTLTGEAVTAEQALQWGLVNGVAATPEQLEALLEKYLGRLLANSTTAMALTKRLLAGMHEDHGREHAAAVTEAAGSDDCKEGVRAFLEKRKPVFGPRQILLK
jgi:enoyl-CoA hydratase